MLLWDQTIFGLFQKGGFAMWPLLFCSVLAFAIIAERFYFHFTIRMNEESFKHEIKKFLEMTGQSTAPTDVPQPRGRGLEMTGQSTAPTDVPQPRGRGLASGGLKDAIGFSRKFKHPLSKISECYLKNFLSDSQRDNVLKREGSLLLEKVEKNLKGLAAITHIAPLLGLLGTVTGLVSAFHRIESLEGQVQPGDLAAGIWEALVTTVFGLVIAIPAMAFFHYFENKADTIARRMQFFISELDEFFGRKTQINLKSQNADMIEEEGTTVR